tara:strand:+ start:40 stop:672 length:633 start_codon:yes stop_codon:yes gene_type:complete
MKFLEFDYAGIYLFYYPHKEENKLCIKVGQAKDLNRRLGEHFSSNASLEVYGVFKVKDVNKLKFFEEKIIKECTKLFGDCIENTHETFEIENIEELEKIKFFSKQNNKIEFESPDVKYVRNTLDGEEYDIRSEAPPCDFISRKFAQPTARKNEKQRYRTFDSWMDPRTLKPYDKLTTLNLSHDGHNIITVVKYTLQKENEVSNTLEEFIQ